LFEPAKGDALVAVLEPMQGGRWQAEPPRKLRVRRFTPSLIGFEILQASKIVEQTEEMQFAMAG